MVKPGIEEILETLNKECLQELWVPEDVFTSIRNGESTLWLGDEGWVISQIRVDKYTGIKQFFIWMAVSYDNTKDIVTEDYHQLKQIAKQNGCEMIAFSSVRKGWIKRAKELGLSSGPTNFVARI